MVENEDMDDTATAPAPVACGKGRHVWERPRDLARKEVVEALGWVSGFFGECETWNFETGRLAGLGT